MAFKFEGKEMYLIFVFAVLLVNSQNWLKYTNFTELKKITS